MMKTIEQYFYLPVVGFLLIPNLSSCDKTNVGTGATINELKTEVDNLREQLPVFMAKVSRTESAVQRLSDLKSQPDSSVNLRIGALNLPVGSIIPWMPNDKLTLEEMNLGTRLPLGFLACNGPHDIDNPDTEFDERKIPHLSAESLFTGKGSDRLIMIIKVGN